MFHSPIIIMANKTRNKDLLRTTSRSNITKAFEPDFMVTLSSSNSFSEHRRTATLKQYLDEITTREETAPDQLSNETWYFFGETFSNEWKDLLTAYELPPCLACRQDSVALSFGIGNRGSGVQWHTHGPGFSEALWGRKHWVLYPQPEKPDYHPDYGSWYWMEYVYPTLQKKPYECTLDPGDIIYFPNEWHHATINLDVYTAFVSTFTQEHLFL